MFKTIITTVRLQHIGKGNPLTAKIAKVKNKERKEFIAQDLYLCG
jgi:hypothetical protein